MYRSEKSLIRNVKNGEAVSPVRANGKAGKNRLNSLQLPARVKYLSMFRSMTWLV